MEYSWNKRKRFIYRICDVFAGLYILLFMFVAAVLIIRFDMLLFQMTGILFIAFAIILFQMFLKNNLTVRLKYKVDNYGIMVEYPKFHRTTYFYRWEEISEISVCDVHHATRGDAFEFVIRIVVGEEPDGPRNKNCSKNLYGYEKWRKGTYEWKHWKQIIVIEYSPERYTEIKNASGMDIKDYRRPYSDAWKIRIPN